MKVSIIIPVFNKLEFTKGCVASIEENTPEEHEIVFIDNGSTDGTLEWLREQDGNPDYKVCRNETNLGFPIACNQGARASTGEFILLLNNDTVVSREWLSGLLEAHNSAPDIACVGPMTNCLSGPQQDSYPNLNFKFQDFAAAYRTVNRGKYRIYMRIVGFCLLTTKKIWDELGGFDEQFSPGNFEDDDFCLRAIHAGYRNLICEDVFIHHYGSITCREFDFAGILATNQAKFIEKWRNK